MARTQWYLRAEPEPVIDETGPATVYQHRPGAFGVTIEPVRSEPVAVYGYPLTRGWDQRADPGPS